MFCIDDKLYLTLLLDFCLRTGIASCACEPCVSTVFVFPWQPEKITSILIKQTATNNANYNILIHFYFFVCAKLQITNVCINASASSELLRPTVHTAALEMSSGFPSFVAGLGSALEPFSSTVDNDTTLQNSRTIFPHLF